MLCCLLYCDSHTCVCIINTMSLSIRVRCHDHAIIIVCMCSTVCMISLCSIHVMPVYLHSHLRLHTRNHTVIHLNYSALEGTDSQASGSIKVVCLARGRTRLRARPRSSSGLLPGAPQALARVAETDALAANYRVTGASAR